MAIYGCGRWSRRGGGRHQGALLSLGRGAGEPEDCDGAAEELPMALLQAGRLVGRQAGDYTAGLVMPSLLLNFPG